MTNDINKKSIWSSVISWEKAKILLKLEMKVDKKIWK